MKLVPTVVVCGMRTTRLRALEATGACVVPVGQIAQFLGGKTPQGVDVDFAIFRDDHFQQGLAVFFDRLGSGCDHHARHGFGGAGGHRVARAPDFDHAGATGPDGLAPPGGGRSAGARDAGLRAGRPRRARRAEHGRGRLRHEPSSGFLLGHRSLSYCCWNSGDPSRIPTMVRASRSLPRAPLFPPS